MVESQSTSTPRSQEQNRKIKNLARFHKHQNAFWLYIILALYNSR